MASAVAKLQRGSIESDATHAAQRFEPNAFVWIPDPTVRMAECLTELGQTFTGGGLATVTYGQPAIKAEIPEVSLQGARHLVVDSQIYSVSEGGVLEGNSVQDLLDSSAFEVASLQAQDAETVELEAYYELSSPVTAFAIPPSALSHVNGTDGCVTTGEQTYRVSLLSSSLGLTYVTFLDGDVAPREIVLNMPQVPQCS
jgi:hypothetical protein